ncbi:uncharacterized protein SAPINGB_P005314 [Magnusiomyces paraingens]|uniref:Receptor L-domain domain-containing protein n=1 Tax=Magnusiomyces paraingens TaxID=2606893 RepID=A0A5E8BZB6_9ASCO|nr:uncharacterized protein SAPINGB_P005314 [Saprochaete ingens]VVT56827.1 unnamed protein product [Saprochaete ingens]
MLFTKAFLASLAMASSAYGQSTVSSASSASSASKTSTASAAASSSALAVCSSTLTASSQADLDTISSCSTFKGDIILASPITAAAINGVQAITGSLSVVNITTLTSLSAPQLGNVSDTVDLRILEALTEVNFPSLTQASTLNLVTMNKISTINFAAGVSSLDTLVVSDTSLTSISGVNPTKLTTLNINNNKYLTALNFSLTYVYELDISSTANSVSINLPKLTSAHNATFRDASSINIANVSLVNSTLSFVNTTVKNIQLPKLTDIEGSLAIVSNSQLTNISFPLLTVIGGGFQIANNSKLASFSGFPLLETVGGAIDFVGDFDNATLPELSTVRGGVTVDSSSEDFNCSSWNALQSANGIRGDSYVCKAATVSTSVAIASTATASSNSKTSSAASATATGESSSSSSSKNGAVGSYGLESSLFGAIALFVLQFI